MGRQINEKGEFLSALYKISEATANVMKDVVTMTAIASGRSKRACENAVVRSAATENYEICDAFYKLSKLGWNCPNYIWLHYS